ncbi:MAG: A/G-specific adenine glycosylase [Bacteroidales bacterium]
MRFSKLLLSWYSDNKRDLPWRSTRDPYLIWLSEIIMQQTRIEQGTPYFNRFATAFPTIKTLANADEQTVLKLWQGLGYYSRARNLHATATRIMNDFDGNFPTSYEEIRQLKGIGDYTAAAIASICFDMPYPVMDGNVLRFISRLYGIVDSVDRPETKRKILAITSGEIDHENPGDFNQAMMEFGAMVCLPANPDCQNCIFKDGCVAFLKNRVEDIPARKPKVAVRNRFMHYLVLTMTENGIDYLFMNKRKKSDIWKNLYDFPLLEGVAGDGAVMDEHAFAGLLNSGSPRFLGVSGLYTHVLTHQKLHARFYRFHSDSTIDLPFILVPLTDVQQFPVPKLIDRYLSENLLTTG